MRKVAVFAFVWAYTANALWIPGGIDSDYWLSVCFPAPYYLLIGGVLGWLYTAAARRWKHGLATAALVLGLVEWARWLFAGQLSFIFLALPFTIATLLASYVVKHPRLSLKDSRLSRGSRFALWCFGLLVLYTSLAPTHSGFASTSPCLSPNGAYMARSFAGDGLFDDHYYIYVGPSRMPLRWFGHCLHTNMYAPATNLHWVSPRALIATAPVPDQGNGGQYCDVHLEVQYRP